MSESGGCPCTACEPYCEINPFGCAGKPACTCYMSEPPPARAPCTAPAREYVRGWNDGDAERLRAALATAIHLLERLDVDPDCWCHPNHFEPHSPLCREISAFVLRERGPRPTTFRLAP